MGKKIDNEIIEKALKDYCDNNMTATDCSNKYGIGRTTLLRYINKHDISKNFTTTSRNYNRDYFEDINTESKAYWLGFIAADGCIARKSTNLEIGLQKRDKKHLEKFVLEIGGTIDMIKDRIVLCSLNNNSYDSSRINIASVKICNDLSILGIKPNKSIIYNKFPNIPNELIRHYLRGYFDGDGCITTRGIEKNTGFQYYNLNLIATEKFLYNFIEALKPIGITEIKLENRNNGMFVWKKNGTNQIKLFLEFLYENSTIYLDRKYIKYLEICRPESTITEDLGELTGN